MPIWGEYRISWRNLVPPVAIVIALACLAFTLHTCLSASVDPPDERDILTICGDQLKSNDPGIVASGTRKLGGLRTPEFVAKAMEMIRPNLKAADPRVVGATAAALGHLGDASSTDAILALLRSQDPAILAGAAEGLGALKVQQALEPVSKLLGNEDLTVRLAAIGALGDFGGPTAEAALSVLQHNPTLGICPTPTEEERSDLERAIADALVKIAAPK